jgi:hypothetical protein
MSTEMNVSTEVMARNEATKAFAVEYFYAANPFALEMYFNFMPEEYLRELLAYKDPGDEWIPKTYPERIVKYKLVADCMLRYYYDRFPSFTAWESDEGIEEDHDTDFTEKRGYWRYMSEELENSFKKEHEQETEEEGGYHEFEEEDQQEVAEFLAGQESRLRFFSRDASIR